MEISSARYNNMQKSMEELSNKLELSMDIIAKLEAEKRQWINDKTIQQGIIQQHLGNSDDIVRQLQNEIRGIKSKLCPDCFKKVR